MPAAALLSAPDMAVRIRSAGKAAAASCASRKIRMNGLCKRAPESKHGRSLNECVAKRIIRAITACT